MIFLVWAMSATIWMETLYWGFWFSTLSYWTATLLTFRFAFASSIAMLSAMTVFFYYFPRVSVSIHAYLRYAYYAFTIFLLVASLTPLIHESLVIEAGVYTADVLGPVYPLYTLNMVLNFVLSLYLATKKYFGLRGVQRRQLVFATSGYFVFVFFAILTNVILPAFDIFILFLQNIVPILTVAFVIPAYIALQRYRFFNLSYVSLNLTRKFIFYILFLVFIDIFYEIGIKLFPQTNLSILIGVGIVVTATILERLNRVVPAFVSESLKEYQRITQELNTQFYSSEGLAELQGDLEKAFLIQLNYINAKLYVVHSGNDKLPTPTYPRDTFAEELQKFRKEPLLLEEIPFTVKNEGAKDLLKKGMKKLHADFVLPLFSEGNLIGFLALRKKEDDGSFAKEEIIEIQSMKRGLEIALMNALLKLNLEEENDLMKNIIKEKTSQLKSKIKQIEELLRQQSDFIAVTAHEFRTPLSIAMFQLEETMHSSNCPPKLRKEARVVEESLVDLKALTEKLFAVQQFDLKKVELKLEKTDLIPLIEKAYADFAPIMKEKGLDFSLLINTKGKVLAQIDPPQMRQVLHNLLTNASKFTPRGGKVELVLGGEKEKVIMCVADSGAGIPDNMKKTIFNKFRTKSAGSGIGLGLYLCKKIIELHKGKIWVEDSAFGGTEMCVQLKRLAK
ncbi:MAG: ATP-binding protein [Candidatus Peregrinibacteria bacterium]|nr:ATP-binding protein [Candidatus Peregrinibacteria bacterium]